MHFINIEDHNVTIRNINTYKSIYINCEDIFWNEMHSFAYTSYLLSLTSLEFHMKYYLYNFLSDLSSFFFHQGHVTIQDSSSESHSTSNYYVIIRSKVTHTLLSRNLQLRNLMRNHKKTYELSNCRTAFKYSHITAVGCFHKIILWLH